jgi:alkylhydroperoxidase family enzyme
MNSHFPDILQGGMRAIGARRPNVFMAFLALAEEVVHAPAGLSPLDRELLGAHVSRRFGCDFCHYGHLDTAAAIVGDDVTASIDAPDAHLAPLFALADKIADSAAGDADIEAVLAAGHSEQVFEDVIFVCALFGFANRLVTGFGLDYRAERDRAGSRALAQGYLRR